MDKKLRMQLLLLARGRHDPALIFLRAEMAKIGWTPSAEEQEVQQER